MKFELESLFIEVTRRCNLKCRHCFRGESEEIDISIATLENTFKGVESIYHLLLTGGEPFLAYKQIKKISEILEKNNIKVKYISIVTNGTILNDIIIETINKFKSYSECLLYISEDKFHEEELKRLGILEQRDRNIAILGEHFRLIHYNSQDSLPYQLDNMGRASTLTEEDLKLLNESGDIKTQYFVGDESLLKPLREKYYKPYSSENKVNDVPKYQVHGVVYIDVNGNIAPVEYPYVEADEILYYEYDCEKNIYESIQDMERLEERAKQLALGSKKVTRKSKQA